MRDRAWDRIVVLDNGTGQPDDLLTRVSDVFSDISILAGRSGTAATDEHAVVRTGSPSTKDVVAEMHRQQANWALVPREGDPSAVIADYLSAARPYLNGGDPGFILISGQPGVRYRRLAVIADISEPVTTGVLAAAAVVLASQTGAELDVLTLGAEPGDEPRDVSEARERFDIEDGAHSIDAAMALAERSGVRMQWVPLGESPRRDELVLDAVRDGGYDLVFDDLRTIDVGSPLGRLRRVRRQLTESDAGIDTAYRLLRDAPCDVAIVLDAVAMRLIKPEYAKAGAAAALSLGVLGLAAAPIARSTSNDETATAPVTATTDLQPEDLVSAAAAMPATAASPDLVMGTPAPSTDSLPETVSDEAMTHINASVAAEQEILAQMQADAAAAQQDQASRNAALEQARTDLALEQRALAEATATADSAAEALDYANSRGSSLDDAGKAAAQASYDKAAAEVLRAEERVEEAQTAFTEARRGMVGDEEAAALQRAADSQAANVAAWQAYAAEADSRTEKVVVPTQNYTLSAGYGAGGSAWSSGYHTGLDFAAPMGTPVYAATNGVVVEAGWAGAYGQNIVIQHDDGTQTAYAHLSSIGVSVGQSVSAGQQIGAVGSTGNSSGPHLHFEVRTSGGGFMDPAAWLGGAL